MKLNESVDRNIYKVVANADLKDKLVDNAFPLRYDWIPEGERFALETGLVVICKALSFIPDHERTGRIKVASTDLNKTLNEELSNMGV